MEMRDAVVPDEEKIRRKPNNPAVPIGYYIKRHGKK